jgi:hypothetical protein
MTASFIVASEEGLDSEGRSKPPPRPANKAATPLPPGAFAAIGNFFEVSVAAPRFANKFAIAALPRLAPSVGVALVSAVAEAEGALFAANICAKELLAATFFAEALSVGSLGTAAATGGAATAVATVSPEAEGGEVSDSVSVVTALNFTEKLIVTKGRGEERDREKCDKEPVLTREKRACFSDGCLDSRKRMKERQEECGSGTGELASIQQLLPFTLRLLRILEESSRDKK